MVIKFLRFPGEHVNSAILCMHTHNAAYAQLAIVRRRVTLSCASPAATDAPEPVTVPTSWIVSVPEDVTLKIPSTECATTDDAATSVLSVTAAAVAPNVATIPPSPVLDNCVKNCPGAAPLVAVKFAGNAVFLAPESVDRLRCRNSPRRASSKIYDA